MPALARTGRSPPTRPAPISADDILSFERSRYEQPAACRVLGSTGTVCLFAIAIGIVLWVPHSPVARVAPAAPLAVAFDLEAVPAAPPAQPVDVPPGVEQHEQEESSAAKPKMDPKEAPIAQLKPVALLLATLSSSAAPSDQPAEHASSEAHAVERTTSPPTVTKPSPTVAARVTSASAEQAALADWQSQLLGHLKVFLHYPRQARRSRQEGVVLVSVRVDRQGNVLEARIDRGSGYPALDNEAIATVRRGSPVPPPTAKIRGDPVTVTIPIQFSLRR
jgi:protein TonB